MHSGLRNLIYAHLGILLLVLSLLAVGGYFGLRSYEKQLARAEALQAQYEQAQKLYTDSQAQLKTLVAADDAQRLKDSVQQATIQAQITKRDSQALPQVVSQGLETSASSKSIENAFRSVLSVPDTEPTPKALPDGTIDLGPSVAQQTVSQLETGNQAKADLKDETQLYSLEVASNSSLSKDLGQCLASDSQGKAALADANKTIAAYKKAAHRSVFKRILDGAEKVGILVAGIELGRHF
jgi:hypothetical protein